MKYAKRCGFGAALLAAALVALGTLVSAQEELGGAKTLYVNASYEEALTVLDKQASAAGTSGPKAAEVQHYRALCFIALGRTAEADQAIALSVAADPFSVPDTSELSPRVASVFTAARARLVPEVARAALAEGRQMMQKGDPAGANRRFEAVTKLLADPALAGRADLTDLTLAATAFSELTKAQLAAAAAAAAAAPQPVPPAVASTDPPPAVSSGAPVTANTPAPTATRNSGSGQPPPAPRNSTAQPPPAARPSAAAVTSTRPATPAVAPPGFIAAVPVSQVIPPWNPGTGFIAQMGFSGAVRVTIDAQGKVTNAVMEPSVYPPYDRQVLSSARQWTYRPATQNGTPVASERLVEIVLRPRSNP
jgi:periplasmic protein TonB